MILTRVVPGPAERIDLDDEDAKARLSALYALPRASWLRLNLISSVNGSAAGGDSTSDSLTNPADRALLGVIRGLADVVLVGAASVRAEGYRIPRSAILAILTGSGDLSGHRFSGEVGPGRVLVLCPASAADRARATLDGLPAEIVVLPERDGRIEPAAVTGALTGRGLLSVGCEGGPSLAGQLLDAGLVDELCLSTGPVVSGTQLPLFGQARIRERRLDLRQLMVDDASTIYARWTVMPQAESPAPG